MIRKKYDLESLKAQMVCRPSVESDRRPGLGYLPRKNIPPIASNIVQSPRMLVLDDFIHIQTPKEQVEMVSRNDLDAADPNTRRLFWSDEIIIRPRFSPDPTGLPIIEVCFGVSGESICGFGRKEFYSFTYDPYTQQLSPRHWKCNLSNEDRNWVGTFEAASFTHFPFTFQVWIDRYKLIDRSLKAWFDMIAEE